MLNDRDIGLVSYSLFQSGSTVAREAFDRIKKELVEAQNTSTNTARAKPCARVTVATVVVSDVNGMVETLMYVSDGSARHRPLRKRCTHYRGNQFIGARGKRQKQ